MSTNRILSRSVATLLALTPFALHAGTQVIVPFGDPTDTTLGDIPAWGLSANWSGDNGAALPGPNDIAEISYDVGPLSSVDIRGSDFTGTPANFTQVAGLSFAGNGPVEVDLVNNDSVANMTLALNGAGGTVPLIQTGAYAVQILGTGNGTPAKTLTLQLKGSGEFNVGDAGLTISAPITQSGTFGFNKTGDGTLVLSGASANTYTGTTTITSGTVIAAKTAGNAIGGNLDVEAGGTFLYTLLPTPPLSNQIADTATVTINGGSFGDFAEPPTNPGISETIANLTVNTGNFSSGRAPTVGTSLVPFTVTGTFKTTGGVSLITRGGVLTTGSTNLGGGEVDLDGGSTTTAPASESRLNVGTGGLTLNGATVNFDSGASGLTTASVGGIVAFTASTGNLTATGTNNFVHLNPGTVGPKANVDLGSVVRTFNIPTAADSLTLGASTAAVTVSSTATGGLIKTGAGTLTLSGSSISFLGSITVSGGMLDLATASFGANTAITVQNGSTLADDAGTGTSSITTLNLGQNATDFGVLNLSPTATLSLTNFSVVGTNTKSTVNIVGAIPAIGDYTIINYGAGIGGAGYNGLALGSTPGGRFVYTLSNVTSNTTIHLVVTADVPLWSGAVSSEWSTATLANPKNWVLNSNNAVTTDYLSTDNAMFSDFATNTTVNLSVADVTPKTVTFTNATKNYTLTGSNAIADAAGGTSLTKSGAGTVMINNTNTFTGAVTLNGGTVSVGTIANSGTPSPLGAGTTITFGGGTLEFTGASGSTNRPITLSGTGGTIKTTGSSLTLTGLINSGGALTKSGNGTLTLGGTSGNTYTGTTVVSAGTLIAGKSAGNAFGGGLTIQGGNFMYAGNNVSNQIPDTATVIVSGGTFGDPTPATPTIPGATDTVGNVSVNGGVFNSGSNASPFTIANSLTVSSGAALVESGGGISAKTVTFSGGTLNLDGGSTSQTSRLIVGTGGLTLTGSAIDLNAGPSAVGPTSVGSVVTLNGGVTSTGTSSLTRLNPTVAAASIDLGGAARTFNVTGTLNVGSVAAPITVTNGSIVKTGNGTLTLSGPQNYAALTTSAGTTVLNNPLGTGTSTLTANAATILNTGQTLASLNVGTGGLVTFAAHTGGSANVRAIDTSALSISGTGQLDITNNAMVVRGTTLAAVSAKIKSGIYNGPNGYYDGPGITSSLAANDPNGITGVGSLDNSEFGYTTFAGVNVNPTDILVKYTYNGDTDLNGIVDTNDFFDFLGGFTGAAPAEWLNGDFDYNGIVDTNDFFLFLGGFGAQPQLKTADSAIMGQEIGQMAAQLGVNGGSGAGTGGDGSADATASQAVVPEPGSMGLLAVGALGLLARRRR